MTQRHRLVALLLAAAVVMTAGCPQQATPPTPSLDSPDSKERVKAVEAIGAKHGD